MGYFVIKLYTEFVGHWQKSFEIVNSFVGRLDQTQLVGYSHNRYVGFFPIPYIAVRFNFAEDNEGKRLAEEIIDDLIERRLIVGKGEWEPFNASTSVRKATETSTKCAFAFKNWMDGNSEAANFYLQNPNAKIQFMSRFLVLLLQQLDFQTHFEEYPISPQFMNLIRACATHCAEQVRQALSEDLNIDFMERFIHHFLNCVHINLNEERAIHIVIQHWEWLASLVNNRSSYKE